MRVNVEKKCRIEMHLTLFTDFIDFKKYILLNKWRRFLELWTAFFNFLSSFCWFDLIIANTLDVCKYYKQIRKNLINNLDIEIKPACAMEIWEKNNSKSSRPDVFLRRCVLKIYNRIYWRTPMLKCDFSKVALHLM